MVQKKPSAADSNSFERTKIPSGFGIFKVSFAALESRKVPRVYFSEPGTLPDAEGLKLMNLPLRLTLVAALAAPASLALAQTAPDAVEAPRARRGGMNRARRGHRHHRGHFRQILRQLNLSDNQKAQLRAIFESSREQRRDLRSNGNPDRAAMRALRQETRRLVNDVLTPAQRTQAAQLRRQHMTRRFDRRIERMTTQLSLTDAQKTAVTRILRDSQTRRRALRENGNVSPDAMRTIRRETRTELSGVLSAEQMAGLRQMRAEHRSRHGRHGRRGGRGNGNGPIRNAAP